MFDHIRSGEVLDTPTLGFFTHFRIPIHRRMGLQGREPSDLRVLAEYPDSAKDTDQTGESGFLDRDHAVVRPQRIVYPPSPIVARRTAFSLSSSLVQQPASKVS